jgi:sugar lactone lactonase YvrE
MDVARGKLYFTDISNRRVRVVDLSTGLIQSIAGGGTITGDGATNIGDGGPSTSAVFSTHPMRVMVNTNDTLFITDAHHNKIRCINPATQIISTFVGNGAETYSGDGGLAIRASLSVPHGARFDHAGNLFIADTLNHRIRRVDNDTELITTVAGMGREGYSGDHVPATTADLAAPLAVDLDGDGNLFIVDTDNDRIRRVDASTGLITTVAGVGEIGALQDDVLAQEACFGRLRDVRVVDSALIVADGNNAIIFHLDLATGIIRHIAGTGTAGYSGDGGPATQAQLKHPYSIALDEAGNLFIKDCFSYRLRRVDVATGTIKTIAGNGVEGFAGDGGPALEAQLSC